jgi:uncharacterized Tic20 family protein
MGGMESPVPSRYDTEKFWAMLVHLSALSGFISGIGFVLGPVLIWMIQKERFPGITPHFKEVINFQISLAIYCVLLVLLSIVTLGLGALIAGPLLGVIAVLDMVFPILAAIKASEEEPYRYPMTIRLIS